MSDPFISFNNRQSSGGESHSSDPASAGTPASSGNFTNGSGRGIGGGDGNTNNPSNEDPRIRQLRIELGVGDDYPIDVLQAILEADHQESAAAADAAAPANNNHDNSRSTGVHTRGRRTWENCQPAPSRPGAFAVGDLTSLTNGDYPIGPALTEEQLMEKRINAVHQIQETLNQRLGYDLRASGQYEEMERRYAEGERECNMTHLERRMEQGEWIGPKPTLPTWNDELIAQARRGKKERVTLKPIEEPLPLPMSLMGGVGVARSGVEGQYHHNHEGNFNSALMNNPEICIGKFVDPGPDKNEEEEKREEIGSLDNTSASKDSSTWLDVSLDESPVGPYDKIVRCWKCRAGLKVHLDVGLVCCPRCRSISPATDTANVALC